MLIPIDNYQDIFTCLRILTSTPLTCRIRHTSYLVVFILMISGWNTCNLKKNQTKLQKTYSKQELGFKLALSNYLIYLESVHCVFCNIFLNFVVCILFELISMLGFFSFKLFKYLVMDGPIASYTVLDYLIGEDTFVTYSIISMS